MTEPPRPALRVLLVGEPPSGPLAARLESLGCRVSLTQPLEAPALPAGADHDALLVDARGKETEWQLVLGRLAGRPLVVISDDPGLVTHSWLAIALSGAADDRHLHAALRLSAAMTARATTPPGSGPRWQVPSPPPEPA